MSTKNFIGEIYGRLRVDGRLGLYARCVCSCGAVCTPRMDKLRDGTTKSCGCLAKEIAESQRKVRPTKPPRVQKCAAEVKLRAVYAALKQRCTNPNNPDYARYGGRGIYLDSRWATPEAFLEWAKPKYRAGLWLERINNDGPYSPDNCALVSPKRQGRNRGNTLWVTDPSGRKPLSRVAAYLHIPYQRAYRHYNELLVYGQVPDVTDFQYLARKMCARWP